ncbi:hypothetical protein DFH27DRAFT_392650 [Peziza echinospora]|nr:hypothetical protein DFH27DRAFT_392650 [Peziza echinospora]
MPCSGSTSQVPSSIIIAARLTVLFPSIHHHTNNRRSIRYTESPGILADTTQTTQNMPVKLPPGIDGKRVVNVRIGAHHPVPHRAYRYTATALGASMWFFLMYRAKKDGAVLLGLRHPWDH